jgi:hypothetical protein
MLTVCVNGSRDSLENIEVGSAQHFTSNIQAIVDHLLSPDSSLGGTDPLQAPHTVYFSLYDRIFISYSMKTADKVCIAITASVLALLFSQGWIRRWRVGVFALMTAPAGLVVGLGMANLVGLVMKSLGKGLRWYVRIRERS